MENTALYKHITSQIPADNITKGHRFLLIDLEGLDNAEDLWKIGEDIGMFTFGDEKVEIVMDALDVDKNTAINLLADNGGSIEKCKENYKVKLKEIHEKDIDLVVSQTNVTHEKAHEMLIKHNADIIEAIMELTDPSRDSSDEEANKKGT